MQLSASIPPPPKDADEAQRVEHTRLRRRLLYSQYEPDLDARIRQAVGNVKAEAWKPIDLTANPYLSIWQQTAVLYDLAPEVATPKSEATLFDLLNAVNAILKRVAAKEQTRDIFEDRWTVSEKIEILLRRISEQATLRFSDLFASATSRTEVVVTFLAVLELMRLRQIVAMQTAEFGEIEITRAQPTTAVLLPEPAATTGATAPQSL